MNKLITHIYKRYSHLKIIRVLKTVFIGSKKYQNIPDVQNLIDDATKIKVDLKNTIIIGLAVYGNDIVPNPIYDNILRYRNFFKYNNIPYKEIFINRSDWIEQVKRCDIIIWGILSKPSRLVEERSKIYFIENNLGVMCYPSFNEVYIYEDKIRFYYFCKIHGFPIVNTFVSNDYSESLEYIKRAKYPIVSKINIGSGSRGVRLIKTKNQAHRTVKKVFSAGKPTYHSYLRQKDYIYFQEYLDDCKFDLRVIVLGNKVFGYYRMKPTNDFRASGAGIFVKKELPKEAIKLALEVANKMNARMLAVDMIKSESKGIFEIIEGSIFFGIETAEQLIVDGVPGYYHIINDDIVFSQGKFWLQDLILESVILEWQSTCENDNNLK